MSNTHRFVTYIVLIVLATFALSTAFAVDIDQNGVEDDVELIWAERYKPSFFVNDGNLMEPEPVEILDSNGDGILSIEDVSCWVVDAGGNRYFEGDYCIPNSGSSICTGGMPFYDLKTGTLATVGQNSGKNYPYLDYGGAGNENPADWFSTYTYGRGETGPAENYSPKVYCHIFKEEVDKIHVQYWYYYPYNDAFNNHEGDWEHISVILQSNGQTDQATFWGVIYYGHEFYVPITYMAQWYCLLGENSYNSFYPYMIDETHPVVFVGGSSSLGSGSSSGGSWPSFGNFPLPGFWNPEVEEVHPGGAALRYNEIAVEIIPNFPVDSPLSGAMLSWFESNPEKHWMRAELMWGHPFANSPLSDIIGSNQAPFTPAYKDSWFDPYPNLLAAGDGIAWQICSRKPVLFVSAENVDNGNAVDASYSLKIDGNSTANYSGDKVLELDRNESHTVKVTMDAVATMEDGSFADFVEWSDGSTSLEKVLNYNPSSLAEDEQVILDFHARYRVPTPAPTWDATVEFVDKSAETLMQFAGSPRNASILDYNNDEHKDMVMTMYNSAALGWQGSHFSSSGAPQFDLVTVDIFPGGNGPLGGASGMINADFDNDGFLDFFAPNQGVGGRLYRNVGGDHFEDYTASAGLNNPAWVSAVESAFSCSWADYDSDGVLDLTLLSSSGDPLRDGIVLTLLHNTGSYFDEVALSGSVNGLSPLWADLDGDHDLDLLVMNSVAYPAAVPPPSPDYPEVLYINQGDGTFVEDAYNRLPTIGEGAFGRIAAISDFNNDGHLDVVYAEEFILTVLLNDGSGYFGLSSMVAMNLNFDRPTDLAVIDFDLDGYQDIVLGSGYIGSQAPTGLYIYRNQLDSQSRRILLDVTDKLVVAGGNRFEGIAAGDFNRDGFSDLYLTRVATEPFFYKGMAKAQASQNSWVGLRLSSPYGANNYASLGATVTLDTGGFIQAQSIDGGSGFASQHENDLIFGLGGYSGSVTVHIKWPTGRTQTVMNVLPNQYTEIVDDSPVIDSDTIQFSRTFYVATGKQDWVFTWETFNASPTSRDTVVLDLSGVPNRCWPEASLLTEETYNVTVTSSDQGNNKFEHILTYANVDCEAKCTIPYTLTSGVSDYVRSNGERRVKISSCILSQ